jgi:phage tail tape-measure protein
MVWAQVLQLFQSFAFNGTNLTDPVGIKAPADFEISAVSDGTGFTDTLTVQPVSGTISNNLVYVRLKAGLSVATYANELITLNTAGAVSKTVNCTGNVVNPSPNITTPSVSNLNGFNYNAVTGGPSASQSFTVGGLYLSDVLGVQSTT